MAVYKESKNNTWRVIYRYTDWTGERKQSQKRGFQTKREAQAWEREQLNKLGADLDMTFQNFVERYKEDRRNLHQRQHLGEQGPHYPNQTAALFRKAENEQHHSAADYPLAE